ncbi:restriction endonuclease subunit S [Bifidobacterium longum]
MNLAISEDAKHRNEKLVISGNCHCPPSFRYSRLSMIRQTSRKYASAWEQRKLGEIVDVCSGRDYKHLSKGPIPVYGTGGYMTSVSEGLSYEEDAIGIGRKGTIDHPYRLNAPFWTVDTLFYSLPNQGIDLDFTLCVFLNVDWKSKDESTGLPSLSKQAINETKIWVPSGAEQRAIGAFFSRLDDLITLHQRKRLSIRQRSPVWS